jgi:diacylglycerol O-acyltransferase
MAPVDAAWLRMDRETNPMVIAALLVLDGRPRRDEVVALLRERLLPHARFRQRASLGLWGVLPHWEDDPLFDLEAHVHAVALPAPGSDVELRTMVSELIAAPLSDRRRPLWQAYVIETSQGTAILVRIHHAIADGIALVRILLELTSEGGSAAPRAVGRPPGHANGVAEWVAERTTDAVTLARLVSLTVDPPSTLRRSLGIRKSVAWSRALSADRLQAVAHAHAAKLHDVLAACIAGALRSAMLDAGIAVPASMRAVVPFYLSDERAAGNHFGLVFLPLPLAEPSAHARLEAVRAEMGRVKSSREPEVTMGVLGALGEASSAVERGAIAFFSRKATLMLTTVPGPRSSVHVLGSVLRDLVVWAPASGSIGVSLSIVSYAGDVRLGVAMGTHLAPEATAIARAFEIEVDALLGEAGATPGSSAETRSSG